MNGETNHNYRQHQNKVQKQDGGGNFKKISGPSTLFEPPSPNRSTGPGLHEWESKRATLCVYYFSGCNL